MFLQSGGSQADLFPPLLASSPQGPEGFVYEAPDIIVVYGLQHSFTQRHEKLQNHVPRFSEVVYG